MKIAYFVNQYPKVSHSFIRREINALERQGITVERFALRTDASELVDQLDHDELNKTKYILGLSIWVFIRSAFIKFISSPLVFLSALSMAVRIGKRSDRGLLRHFIYFIEACQLENMLSKQSVSHIHAHFGTNSTTVVMLCHLLGGPQYSFTVHGPEEFDKPEFISLTIKIKHSAFVVAISSFGKSQLFRWIAHDLWHKVKIVHCGLDKAFYDVEITPAIQNKKMVCVGRLCEQKGQQLLVEAAVKLDQEGEDFQLVLAGDGPMRKDIEKLIKTHGLESKVTITGWISSDRVRDELLDCTALVLPSFAEGLPVVIMEAMALARPVLTTYIAGIPELVIHGENGWLIPAGSLDALTTSMRELLHSKDSDIAKMGRHARERVLQRHNIDIEAAKLSRFIKKRQP